MSGAIELVYDDAYVRSYKSVGRQAAHLSGLGSSGFCTDTLAYYFLLATAIPALTYTIQRTLTLLRRGLASIRTRGLSDTLAQVMQRFAPVKSSLQLTIPPQREHFAAFTLAGCSGSSQAEVRASIVIPVYNKFSYTDVCLRALASHQSIWPFEVIVIDDASSDESWKCLQEITGIRAYRNQKNLGFIGACNAGAQLALGEYLIFLNNDTAVQPGFLDAMIATLQARRDVGLLGAMLIYPDGRLQESGGIVFRDGSAWNYGRFANPLEPAYSYLREVDYCSGAAIAMRRTLFAELGQFDVHYAPAYYEDTDLAFKVRQAGLKVFVQPAAKVVHFEGISSGTDLQSGIKRFQPINHAKFFARWQENLATHPQPPPAQPIDFSCSHRAKRWVLVVDAAIPKPDKDSGSLRMINLLKILLAENCAVTFVSENLRFDLQYGTALQQLGVQLLVRPFVRSIPSWLARHGARFDVVLLSRYYIAAPLLPLVRKHCVKARVIFDTVDLHYVREAREAALLQDKKRATLAEKTKAQELAIMRAADTTLVVSHVEQALLNAAVPHVRVEILSNIHEVPGRQQGFDARAHLLFVGGFQHQPNIDAISWFVREVFPRVRQALPDVQLHIVGSNTPASVSALASASIVVHGYVPDISTLLAQVRLSIAPLRYGAGVKGKVNMAMAHGVPVIATPLAAEGMFCTHGVDIMLGEDAERFALALIQAYHDEALWLRLSNAGLENVRRHFSFDAALQNIRKIFGL
jgi:O-antigen biosynthesis protein